MKIKVKLDQGAIAPTRAHKTDAGLDLYSPKQVVIAPGEWACIDTGVHVAIPENHVGLITSKSGLMLEGITSRGTIDCGYTGRVRAVLYNHSQRTHIIKKGQKITQLVIVPIVTPEIEYVQHLDDSERGDGGFGSTGRF